MFVIDRVIALVIIAGSILVYWKTTTYPPEVVAFPKFLLAIFFLLSILLFIFPRSEKKYDIKRIFSHEKVTTLALLLAYTIIFPFLGYFVTTLVFTVIYLWIYQRNGLTSYFIYSIIYCGAMYLIFQKFLYVWFPKGLLI